MKTYQIGQPAHLAEAQNYDIISARNMSDAIHQYATSLFEKGKLDNLLLNNSSLYIEVRTKGEVNVVDLRPDQVAQFYL